MAFSMAISPVTESGLHPVVYIAAWMLLSNEMILSNKYVLDVAKFAITLTFLHLGTTTVLTQLLARFTPLITRPSSPITGRLYLRTILPIGILYTFSLVCANKSYTALPLPNIQILKGLAPLTTLLLSWMASMTNPKMSTLVTMTVIAVSACYSASVGVAKTGGIWLCVVGAAAECGRILVVERLLKAPRRGRFPAAAAPPPVDVLEEEQGERPVVMPVASGSTAMSPLVALYYFAPVCAVLSASLALVFEMEMFRAGDVQPVAVIPLTFNCALAFLLNVVGVFVIGKTSALTVSLLGVMKSPFAVVASFLIWKTHLAFNQIMGYGVSLAVMMYHGLSTEALNPYWQQFDAWVGRFMSPESGALVREANESTFKKASAYLGSLITIEHQDCDVQRGRPPRREGTPWPCPEKIALPASSPNKGGESLSPGEKVAGRLD